MKIIRIKCQGCGLNLKNNRNMYVTDTNGKRIICYHPCEGEMAMQVLRQELNWLQRKTMDMPFSLFDIFDIKHGITPLQKLFGFKDIRALIDSRTGVLSNVLCFDCCEEFDLDMKHDNKNCPTCRSENVFESCDLVGMSCPKCKSGVFVKRDTGMIT